MVVMPWSIRPKPSPPRSFTRCARGFTGWLADPSEVPDFSFKELDCYLVRWNAWRRYEPGVTP
jgi:hypothetical protein